MSATSRAIAVAAQAAERLGGIDVVYHRGDDSVPLKAVPGRTRYELVEGEGHITVHYSRDYLIIASKLVLDEDAIEPQLGDRVVETATGREHTLLDWPGEPCWRWSDEHRVRIRVHTKETAQS